MVNKEAKIFYKQVMEGNNVFAQGIIGKVTELCQDLTGTDPVQVVLTDDEGKWLVDGNHGKTLRQYLDALTGNERVLFEWFGSQSVLHIEDPNDLCEECKDLSKFS